MPVNDSKALVRTYVECVWNRADTAAFGDLTTPTFTYTLGGQPPRNGAATKEFVSMVHGAFPDWRVEICTLVAEDGVLVVQWNGHATHSGPFYGLPPTGKHVVVSGINLYRVENGKIAEEWEQMDSLGLLQQIGGLPPRDVDRGEPRREG